MELVSIKIAGWKRFRTPQTLQTSGKLVAILGPNEAGKSSLLKAIRFLRSPWESEANDHSRDSDHFELSITGYFSLNKNELAELGLTKTTRAILTKGPEATWGKIRIEPPAPPRATKLRDQVRAQIGRCLDNDRFTTAISAETFDALDDLNGALRSAGPDLKENQFALIERAASLLRDEDVPTSPGYVSSLHDRLGALLENEKKKSPSDVALDYVRENLPAILFFGPDERDLKQTYTFDELGTKIPTALSNLAAIAGLDITKFIEAVEEDDPAKIESLRAQANERLRVRFEEDWSQSGVRVSFAVRSQNIDIVIENEPHKFTNLAERSDGFRQFVALQSFIMKERADRPILLIDEAETHLHYDAQADLVQMLQKQAVVRKVIYSTHSAGCLPEDLGNGVRVIVVDSPQTSKIVNRFWGSQGLGFDPLLIGMGASTLAFFPIRKALIVEGEAEMLVLPTMMRAALEVDSLNFQVVPGLARANKSALPLGDANQSRVAYLVDGDAGGRALSKELRQNKVEPKCIFSLDDAADADITLEDLLSDEILTSSASLLIENFSPGVAHPTWARLGKRKFAALAAKFEAATKKKLQKVDLAYAVLEVVRESPDVDLIDAGRIVNFRKLAKKISGHFAAESKQAG